MQQKQQLVLRVNVCHSYGAPSKQRAISVIRDENTHCCGDCILRIY